MVDPSRGDIWWANLSPAVGREQAGIRPVLVVSVDTFNHGPRGLVTIVPFTRVRRAVETYPFHVAVSPAQSGLSDPSIIMCEQSRTISKLRLRGSAPIGRVGEPILVEIRDHLITFASSESVARLREPTFRAMISEPAISGYPLEARLPAARVVRRPRWGRWVEGVQTTQCFMTKFSCISLSRVRLMCVAYCKLLA